MKKYYYIYKILFETGHYYIGRRTSTIKPCYDTDYTGSPSTNKDYWGRYSFRKIILEETNSSEELTDLEYAYIGDNYKNDPLCLNEHNALNYNHQSSKGKRWWNNGKTSKLNITSPGEGWKLGRLNEDVLKSAETRKKKVNDKKWWFYENEELFSSTSPGEGWKLGKPSISEREKGKKKPKTSKALLGKKKSEAHKEALKKSKQKIRHLYEGDNNVMRSPEVKKKHAEAVSSVEYRKKVSDAVKQSDRWNDEKRKRHSEMMSNRMKENNPSSKKVKIGDRIYNSISQAMKETGLSRYKLKKYIIKA